MKTPKKFSKEPSLPSQDETRRANVLREEMLSQFRTLGEAFSLLRDDVHSMKPQIAKIDKLDADAEILKSVVATHSDTIRFNTEATRANTEAIISMHADLKNMNQRVEVIEARLAS